MRTLSHSPVARYPVAAAAIALAVVVRLSLDPVLGDGFPFATLFFAVLAVAWYAGFGPALFATVLGAPLAARLLLPPRNTFAVTGFDNQAGLLLYLLVGTGIAVLGGFMHRSRERAVAAAAAARRADAARLYLAAIVEGSEDAIIGKDLDGTISSWNAAAERLYGYAAAEVVGKPFSVLVPPDRAGEVEEMAGRLRRGERVDHFETVRRRKDGTLVPVSVSYSPIRGPDGRLVGAAVITRDVTEQKHALAALRASEARFAALIHNAPAIVFLKDPAGVYLMVNRRCAENVGLSIEQNLGKTDHDLFPPAVAEAFRRDDQEVLRTGQVRTFEETFEVRGRRYTYLTSKFPLPGESGRPIGVCGIATDITDRKAAEERLREEVRVTETLNRLGPKVAAELDLAKVVQLVTDEATQLTEAQFGAFFYNVRGPTGEAYMLYTLSGAPREAFAGFPMPRNTAVFDPTFRGQGVVRLDDVTKDPRYGQNAPHQGMPAGHLPVRSYLAVPVVSRSGEVIGGLFFGHAEVGVFTERHERLAAGMAAQAAIAIDNARLYGQVQESEERFRQLAEHITDVFWLVDAKTRRLLYVSPAYEDIWGRSRQSLYDRPGSFLDGVHPEDRDRVRALSDRLTRGEPGTEEYRVVRPDGSVRWVSDRGYPIRDADGTVTRVAGIVEDITARKRDEINTRFLADASVVLAALADEASALQKVAALAVPHFADWCAADMAAPGGSIRRVAVAHVDPAKVRLAHEVTERWPPDPNAAHGVADVLRTGRPQLVGEITDEMLTATIRDPEYRRVLRELGLRSYMAVPLSVRGKALGVISFITAESARRYDETDLAVAEDLARRAAVAIENAHLYQALKEADRRKDEFLATLAHELRNPLAPIRNSLYLLKTSGAGGATLDRAVAMMGRQTDHLTRLVDDLLDVSRVMRGKIELRPERVDLGAVAARAVETAQPLLDARRHRLTVALPERPVWVRADPVRLAQVVGNLVTNAAKYTEPGGEVRLSIEAADGKAVLRVADTGIGIAPDVLPKVFDLFFQADTSAAGTQGGLGIGLTLVKSLVELHGGTVEAHSEGPGKGSEFVVRLPALPDAERGTRNGSQARAPAPDPAAPQSKRVLVVDDHADAADSLATLLRMDGHDVRVARSGPDAVEAAQADPPDVVLLDLGMPGMDGFEVARRLRQGPAARTFIAALTGWGQEEDRRRTREAGFDHHLVKPADPDDLRELLARVGGK